MSTIPVTVSFDNFGEVQTVRCNKDYYVSMSMYEIAEYLVNSVKDEIKASKMTASDIKFIKPYHLKGNDTVAYVNPKNGNKCKVYKDLLDYEKKLHRDFSDCELHFLGVFMEDEDGENEEVRWFVTNKNENPNKGYPLKSSKERGYNAKEQYNKLQIKESKVFESFKESLLNESFKDVLNESFTKKLKALQNAVADCLELSLHGSNGKYYFDSVYFNDAYDRFKKQYKTIEKDKPFILPCWGYVTYEPSPEPLELAVDMGWDEPVYPFAFRLLLDGSYSVKTYFSRNSKFELNHHLSSTKDGDAFFARIEDEWDSVEQKYASKRDEIGVAFYQMVSNFMKIFGNNIDSVVGYHPSYKLYTV